jgi:hypothetical protein
MPQSPTPKESGMRFLDCLVVAFTPFGFDSA